MQNVVRSLAIGRIAFGAAMLLKPDAAVRGWIGPRAASYGGTQAITQGFGARDLGLGAGTLATLMSGRDAREWVLAGAFGDLADFAATATADDIPLSGRLVVLAMAGSAIAISFAYIAAGRSNELAQ